MPPSVTRDGFARTSAAPASWEERTASLGFTDVRYHVARGEAIAKITMNRPALHNSFRPRTVDELIRALALARNDLSVGVIILTGEGAEAFCAGGDQSVRGEGGYDDGSEEAPRLQILDFQVQMRRCPKPVVAMVAGYAIGGGHILHMLCDLTISADNAVYGQTGPRVGSFDGGHARGPALFQPASHSARSTDGGGHSPSQVRLGAHGAAGGAEEGARDLVYLQILRRGGGLADGVDQRGGPAGVARDGNAALVPPHPRVPPVTTA